MDKKLIIITAIALIGFVVFAYFATNTPKQTTFPKTAVIQKGVDHTQGSGKHILVEYSDLQCPACKAFHDYLEGQKKADPAFAKVLTEKYTLVYRHFPLTTIHPFAETAAKVAEAAGRQGKFFEFVDKAFAQQKTWVASENPTESLINITKELGLDTEKIKTDMQSTAVSDRINANVQSGLEAQVDSTPSFYLDGQKIVNLGSFDDLKRIIIESAR